MLTETTGGTFTIFCKIANIGLSFDYIENMIG